MPKEAVFTMKLEPELREAFMAATAAEDRPASQDVREMMRTYIEQRQQENEYEQYLHRKIEISRESMRKGRGVSNEELEAEYMVRRQQITDKSM